MLETIKLEEVEKIAKEAGDAIMEIYERDFQVDYKDDKSPLTEADTRSNDIICAALEESYPEIPILSEEGKSIPYATREAWEYFWLIDPIDGTKEFIKKNGEFTVNIALIHRGAPVLGVVYAPALGDMYKAKKDEGAFKVVLSAAGSVLREERLPLAEHGTRNTEHELFVVASKSHLSKETQEFIDLIAHNTEHITRISKGSSLKLVMVAEGSADIYPRLAPTMEWDTAAADAVVREAGKMSYRYEEGIDYLDGKKEALAGLKLPYNKESLLNSWFVVV
jgi:3'(2'), 5'-bisphosphate nucleotidase